MSDRGGRNLPVCTKYQLEEADRGEKLESEVEGFGEDKEDAWVVE